VDGRGPQKSIKGGTLPLKLPFSLILVLGQLGPIAIGKPWSFIPKSLDSVRVSFIVFFVETLGWNQSFEIYVS